MNWEIIIVIAVVAVALIAIFLGPIWIRHNFKTVSKEAAVANNDLHNAIKDVGTKVDKVTAEAKGIAEKVAQDARSAANDAVTAVQHRLAIESAVKKAVDEVKGAVGLAKDKIASEEKKV